MTSSEKDLNVRMKKILELKTIENVILYNLSSLLESLSFSTEQNIKKITILC